MSLELVDMSRSFPEFDIGLSLSVEDGELLTLLGPSGCGKTTTLNLVAGFLVPDGGRVILHGRDVTMRPPYERGMGVVFQDYSLFPNLDVFGNVAFGLRMAGWNRTRTGERVRALLDLVRLSGYESRRSHELSGGEQQRVALARALAPKPGLLLLDEPLSALDASLRAELRGEIRRIQQELGITTLYVTHDQEEAFSISDRVAVMNRGTIEQVGTPGDIYKAPRTVFTAGFIGIRNRVRGVVRGRDGATLRIETPIGEFRTLLDDRPEDPARFSAGSAVTLMFRAVHARIGRVGDRGDFGGANVVTGRVSRVEFMGEYTRVEVSSRSASFYARCPAESPVLKEACAPGDAISLSVDPGDILTFPA
jgi:ABC-type Fe3+/spermidine/putrescine transport system ATPase subunit